MVKRGKLSREFFPLSFPSTKPFAYIFGRETALSFTRPLFFPSFLASNQPSTSHFQGAPVLINPPSGGPRC